MGLRSVGRTLLFVGILFFQLAVTLAAVSVINSSPPPYVFHEGLDIYHWRAAVIGRWNQDVVIFNFVLTPEQELKLVDVTTIKGRDQKFRIMADSPDADMWYRRFEDILPLIEPEMMQQIQSSEASNPAGQQVRQGFFLPLNII